MQLLRSLPPWQGNEHKEDQDAQRSGDSGTNCSGDSGGCKDGRISWQPRKAFWSVHEGKGHGRLWVRNKKMAPPGRGHHPRGRLGIFTTFPPENTDLDSHAWMREAFWKSRSPAHRQSKKTKKKKSQDWIHRSKRVRGTAWIYSCHFPSRAAQLSSKRALPSLRFLS